MSTPTFLGPLIGKGVGQCELVNAERGSVLASQVEPAFDSTTRKKGLLGRDSIPDDYALIIAPCSAVHTFGMRTPLDLVFVAKNGTITKTCRGVQPWRMAGSMRAHAVVEAAPGFIDRHEIVPGETVALRETASSGRPAEATPLLGLMPVAEPRATPARLTTRKRVTLADIIARKTPLAWFETVAVVQELCETVLKRGPADDLRVPELKHITLTAEGNVTLLSEGPSGHSPVQRAGLVLLALTPEEQLPMQLRLLTLEEVSPRPRLSSLKDLHRELEFFERPDRQSIVREVYRAFPASIQPCGGRIRRTRTTPRAAAAEAAPSVVDGQERLGRERDCPAEPGGCRVGVGLAAPRRAVVEDECQPDEAGLAGRGPKGGPGRSQRDEVREVAARIQTTGARALRAGARGRGTSQAARERPEHHAGRRGFRTGGSALPTGEVVTERRAGASTRAAGTWC